MVEIADIYTVTFRDETPVRTTEPRRAPWTEGARVANPMTCYPRYAEVRGEWTPSLDGFGVVVEATDGSIGFATGGHGTPVASLIDEYLGPRVEGENCMAIEKIHDMLVRLCSPFGATGIASFAVSAIDLALWDLKGHILDRPVYELLGGPARDELSCYATGNDTDWHVELGFEGTKLACPYGPADGKEGLRKTEDLVAETRDLVGDGVEVMLDCWMAFDETYTVRLANRLAEYDLKWMEETLPPEKLDAHESVRDRLPAQTLATGEHWYTSDRFQQAANRRLVDIFQPDINWVGGLTTVRKISDIAEAAGINVILHGGGNTPYGQHATCALPGLTWTEFFVGTPPGVPLEEGTRLPGTAIPEDGTIDVNDDSGFGIDRDRIEITDRYTTEGPIPNL